MRWAAWLLASFLVVGCGVGAHGPGDDGGTGSVAPDAGNVADAGVAPECDGLLPAKPGAAFSIDVFDSSAAVTCDTSTVDGQGVVAALGRGSGTALWYDYVPPYGARSGSFQSAFTVVPQPSGFIALWGTSPYNVTLFSAYGEMLNPTPVGNGPVALGPAFGAGAISFAAGSAGLTVRKHDGGATEVAQATFPGTLVPLGGAEDASSAVLVLTSSGGAVNATWVDLGRATSGPSFRVGTGGSARALPLLGSGIAVQIDGRWMGVAQPGESTLRAAPAWLGDAADFAPIRGAKAYAIVPPSGGVIAVVSSQGNSCGTVAFPGVNGTAVGLDGTVVGSTGTNGCTKYVWRNALR